MCPRIIRIPDVYVTIDDKARSENQEKPTDEGLEFNTPSTGKYPNSCAITKTNLRDLCKLCLMLFPVLIGCCVLDFFLKTSKIKHTC
jgi:hypothetical protein